MTFSLRDGASGSIPRIDLHDSRDTSTETFGDLDTEWANNQSEQAHMETLSPELKLAVNRAGDSPVRLTDPETHRDYVLVSAEVYERLLNDQEDRREQAAFLPAAKRNAKARLREDD
jgi:hypothetical protein